MNRSARTDLATLVVCAAVGLVAVMHVAYGWSARELIFAMVPVVGLCFFFEAWRKR